MGNDHSSGSYTHLVNEGVDTPTNFMELEEIEFIKDNQ